MGQEDFFKRQLDQLTIVLGKVLAKFLKIKQDSTSTEARYFFKAIEEELNIYIPELLAKPPSEFLSLLQLKYGYKIEHLDLFAEIMFETAFALHQNGELEKSKELFSKCLLLYENINANKKEVSLNRVYRISEIKKILENS